MSTLIAGVRLAAAAKPAPQADRFALQTEAASGFPISAAKLTVPLALVDYGLRPSDRWWSMDEIIDKSDDKPLSIEVRFVTSGEKATYVRSWSADRQRKEFALQRADGRTISMEDVDTSLFEPFFLPQALDGDRPVIIVEGLRAAAALRRRGHNAVGLLDATTLPAASVLARLAKQRLLLWPDNDDIGLHHMIRLRGALAAAGAGEIQLVKWVDGPWRGDAANFEGDDASLSRLLEDARAFPPDLLAHAARAPRLPRIDSSLRLRPATGLGGIAR